MKDLKYSIIIGIVFVLITGTLSHFLYSWTGNNTIVGFFVPVSESVWEHMKLLFFPMLVYTAITVFNYKEKYPCMLSSFCSGILAGTLLIPFFFYAYTYFAGKSILVVDILIFILSVLIAFWLSYKLIRSCKAKPYTLLLSGLVCLLFVCFILFTCCPPKLSIFENPAVTRTFSYPRYNLRPITIPFESVP